MTKADAVSGERLAEVVAEAGELVPGAPVIPVSAVTGTGLDELRGALAALPPRPRGQMRPARLPADRRSRCRGRHRRDRDALVRLDRRGRPAPASSRRGWTCACEASRCTTSVARADAGRRVAVALPGVERRQIRRGEVLARAARIPVSYRLDVELAELEPIPDDARLQVHHGTAEGVARVVRLSGPFAQLRLARPLVAARGDRVVLRAAHGGRRPVLDPAPPRHRPSSVGSPSSSEVTSPRRSRHPCGSIRSASSCTTASSTALERAGPWVFSSAWLAELRGRASRADRSRATRSTRACSVPAEPWAARRRFRACPSSGAARRLYLPGAAASAGRPRRGGDSTRATELGRGRRSRRRRSTTTSSPASSRRTGRLVRLGDGYAIGADAFGVAAGRRCSRSVARRRRHHAGALPRPRGHGPPGRATPPRAVRCGRADAPGGRPPRLAEAATSTQSR